LKHAKKNYIYLFRQPAQPAFQIAILDDIFDIKDLGEIMQEQARKFILGFWQLRSVKHLQKICKVKTTVKHQPNYILVEHDVCKIKIYWVEQPETENNSAKLLACIPNSLQSLKDIPAFFSKFKASLEMKSFLFISSCVKCKYYSSSNWKFNCQVEAPLGLLPLISAILIPIWMIF